MCDCPRTNGNEMYWDGTQCADAGECGDQCSTSGFTLNINYQCLTITTSLTCDAGTLTCQ